MTREKAIFIAAIVLSASNVILCIVMATMHPVTYLLKRVDKEYSYTGHDYPRSWPIGPLSRSYMPLEDSVHYNLQSEIGRTEWATLLPNNNSGTIYLGSSQRPFSISLFHHLRCLDILRVELDVELDHLGEDPPDRDEQDRLIGHCMGYIRQMILCHSDTRLESVRAISGASISYSDVTHTCRDWTAVFRAADENSRAQFS